ncbi:MAG: hypothetical protein IJN46_03280 [Lachnospiraceae bacterium]|nr:hypothetical protein [Lachnospiraceae bacterium]
MKYISQLDYSEMSYVTKTDVENEEQCERGKHTTVRSSGCGLCASIMVADRLLVNYDFDLQSAIQLSYDMKANHLSGTDYKRYAPAFAEKLGLSLEMTNDPERLCYCLRTGGAAVLHVAECEDYIGVFTHGGHYVAAIAEEPDGRIAILDPSFREGKYDEEGRKGKVEIKNGVICLCDLQVVEKETAGRTPGMYLFWRR